MRNQRAALPNVFSVRNRIAPDLVIKIALACLALLAVFPFLSVLLRAPGTNSGSFLTFGSAILDGSVPYRDFWDHRPPMISFLNAFGLVIGGPRAFGVWVLEFVSLTLAALMLFALLKRYFGATAAGFGAAGLLANFVFVSEFGNLPEEYGLPLQIGILLLLSDMLTRSRFGWRPFALGILLGLSVSLKLSLIGTGLAAVLFLIIAILTGRTWRRLYDLLWIGAGAAFVWGGWAAYFAAHHALVDFWDQAFRYPLFYSGVTNLDRVAALEQALKSLYQFSGFFAIGALAWLVVVPFLFFNEERFRAAITDRWTGAALLFVSLLLVGNSIFDDRSGQFYEFSTLSSYRLGMLLAGLALAALSAVFLTGFARSWSNKLLTQFVPGKFSGILLPLAFAFVDLPVQFGMASLAGSREMHAYLPVLPSMAILIAFLVWSLLNAAGPSLAQSKTSVLPWLAVLSLPVLFTGGWATVNIPPPSGQAQVQQAVLDIQQMSEPDQPILQWGAQGGLYFLAGRPAASRFRYQQPLFMPGYTSLEKVQGFLSDLQAAPPVLIVDTRQDTLPLVFPGQGNCDQLYADGFIEQSVRSERDARFPQKRDDPLPYVPPEMNSVYHWVCERYELLPQAEPDMDAWRFYRLRAALP